MDSLRDARESLRALKMADIGRYDFIEHITEQMKVMLSEKAKIQEEYEDLERVRDSYRHDLNECRAELKDLKSSTARGSFVLVLVDGDAAPFQDELVRGGTLGGDSAVRKLRQSVVEYISSSLGIATEYKVIIRVYSKMQYLNQTYSQAGILQGGLTLQRFVQGFNRINTLCEYADAGNDKQGADRKVQSTMELFVNNVHCKHIILCASSDDNYAGFLRDYIKREEESDNVTLIESIPFPRAFAEVSLEFRRTEFPDVFRKTKIVVGELNHEGTGATVHDIALMATDGKEKLPGDTTGSFQTSSLKRTARADPLPAIPVNAANQRVDQKLPQYDPNIVAVLKGRKLCNQHFLSRCGYPSGKCSYSHKGDLKPADLAALQFIARLGACKTGVYCRDSACVASHMCIYGAKCNHPNKCRYPKAMHNLNPEAVQSVPASS